MVLATPPPCTALWTGAIAAATPAPIILPNIYTITGIVIGGNGTISCTSPVILNATSTCTITPNAGYQLATLTDNGGNVFSSVSNNSYTISNVTTNHIVIATFAIGTYTLTYTAGTGGTISGAPYLTQTVSYGADGTTVTAVSNPGYHFLGWDDGSTDNPRTDINVTSNISVTANFAMNERPNANSQDVVTDENVPISITLSAVDLYNPSLAFSISSYPANGTLSAIGSSSCSTGSSGFICTGTVIYTPTANFNGHDSFSFKVTEGVLESDTAAVSLLVRPVNSVPVALPQILTTDNYSQLSITLSGNDLETTPGNLTFTVVTAPAHGTLSGTPPSVVYTPDPTYKGPDPFTFTVTDRGDPDNCGPVGPACSAPKTSAEATVSLTITDGTPPMTSITKTPATLSNDPNPIFGFTGTDNTTATGDLAFECSLDSAGFSVCGNPGYPTTQYHGLGEGLHTFLVRAKDQSGNMDTNPPSYSWTIDTSPPDTLIDTNPDQHAKSATATFTFHATEGNSTFSCTLDGGSPDNCDSGSKDYNNLFDGSHTFTVAARDQAGNVDPSPATYTWTIDTTVPDTAIDSHPADPTTNTSATFTFHGSDPSGQDTFQCSLDEAAFTACTSGITYNNLALGTHTFQVRATDQAGNTDANPAGYTWTIGQVTLDNYTIDTDFSRFDGFDVVFARGFGSSLKLNSTNPDSFNYQIKLTNNTGKTISPANGNTATAIITVPGLPPSCGGVPCNSKMGQLGDPAFVIRGQRIVHLWPGHDRDFDDDDDMPVSVQYMTLPQYQSNGNSCTDRGGYGAILPSNGAPKCIKITGFNIPVKHSARIRLNFQFRLKGTDGWDPRSQQLFFAGFVFQAATSVSFGANIQTTAESSGLVGAGSKATAIGGYAFDASGAPLTGYTVRLFTKMGNASCTSNTKLVAQDQIDENGFYYIWRTGTNQHIVAPNLPSGMQYAVQLCNGSTPIAIKTIDSRLSDKEFEQVDFEQ